MIDGIRISPLKKIKKYIKNNTGFLIRLDDIAENMKWEFMEEAEVLFDRFNIKFKI